jgi:hypothetical protein
MDIIIHVKILNFGRLHLDRLAYVVKKTATSGAFVPARLTFDNYRQFFQRNNCVFTLYLKCKCVLTIER